MQNGNSKFKIFKKFKKNILLKNYTTFKIGGPAKYFLGTKDKEDLTEAIIWAKQNKLPFFILGEGSNLLVSDKGFNGLIIKIQDSRFKIQDSYLHVEAGASFSVLVRETGKIGLAGLEWAGGLPGTLGGAVLGNAGAFGGETKDTIVWVEALDKNLNVRKLAKKECGFGYRASIFKKRGWVVLSALMKLRKGDRKNIQAVARAHIKQRKERGPLEYPNAGSVFKNCRVKDVPERVQNLFKNVIKIDPFPVVPAAALIAKSGVMGKKAGSAQVSTKHPNFIVNLGKARAEEVRTLINLVKKKVKNKFGVNLQEEIQYLGFEKSYPHLTNFLEMKK